MHLNADVLELVFARLDGADLAAAALVSRAFLSGAIPALYARVEYTARHAKRARRVVSPFATLAAHADLAACVRRVAVHAAPTEAASHLVCPVFLRDLARALALASNVRAFVCTAKILPPLLPHLVPKPRLHHLRIAAALGSRQMAVLRERTALHSLSLDFPAWNVVDALPAWSAAMQRSLAHLTLFMSQDIDPAVLDATLAHLPRLRGLHLVGCPRLPHAVVLKALSHTPDLRELSLTIFPSQDNALDHLRFPVPPLTHLSIDVRASYPGLKTFIARIIARLSPRDALAICGGWIGEIKASSERADPPHGPGGHGPPTAPGAGQPGQNLHVWQGHVHLHGPVPGQANGHGHENDQPNQIHGGNPVPPFSFFGFPFPVPNPNPDAGDDDDGSSSANPPNADPIPDPSLPCLVSSLPSTLSVVHLPQLSPAALREVVERCQGIRVLGIVIGSAFGAPVSVKASKTTTRSGTRPEVNVLAEILSRARVLRELIIDTNGTDAVGNNPGANPEGKASTSLGSGTLLTPRAVRLLMRESPCLRRIVGEGRVWESRTPISPAPGPHDLAIDLTLSKARYGPNSGNNHTHGPPGFATHGGGMGQMEAGNDHWFWLTDSASGGNVYGGV